MSECEYKDCGRVPTLKYSLTAIAGKNGVASYCTKHGQEFAEPSTNHAYMGEVSQ